MHRYLLLALALPSLALAQTDRKEGAPAGAESACTRHQGAFAPLIGGTPEAAGMALLAMPGIASVRYAGPGAPMTQDFRPDRATVMTREGRVERIECG